MPPIAAAHEGDTFGRLLTLDDPTLGTYSFVDESDGGAVTLRRVDYTPPDGSDDPAFSMDISDGAIVFTIKDEITFEVSEIEDDFLIAMSSRDEQQEFRSTLSFIEQLAQEDEGEQAIALAKSSKPKTRSGSIDGHVEYPGRTFPALNKSHPRPKNATGEIAVEFVPTGPCGVPSTGAARLEVEVETEIAPNFISNFEQKGQFALAYDADTLSWNGAIQRGSLATVADVVTAGTTEALYDLIVSQLRDALLQAGATAAVTMVNPKIGLPVSLIAALPNVRRAFQLALQIETVYAQREWATFVLSNGTSSETVAPFEAQAKYRSQTLALDSEKRLVSGAVTQLSFSASSPDASQVPSLELVLSTPVLRAEEDYSVTAVLSCDDALGLRVRMDVVGTDGFESNLVFNVFPGAVYRIFVPGAEAGVLDTITATILTADDTIINTSSVTLRFQ